MLKSTFIKALASFAFIFSLHSPAIASEGGIGLSLGVGFPYLSQSGLNLKFNNNLGLSLNYHVLDMAVGLASLKLSMPEVILQYHPFDGSFFIGAGIGQESLNVSSTDANTNLTASASVKAITGIVKLGWMWGIADNGFWMGMDYAYIFPNGASVSIDAPGLPSTNQSYADTEKAAKEFGETAYGNFTLLRIGYIF
jgi:hypothetical protein